MKIIIRPRGGGKTTELIKLASQKPSYIVCHSIDEAFRISAIACDMGLHINLPITYAEFLGGRYGYAVGELLIDNVDMLLDYISNVKIGAITITKED